MNNVFGAYLETYHKIKLIIPSNIDYSNIELIDKNGSILLEKDEILKYNDKNIIILKSNYKIDPSIDYTVKINGVVSYPLLIGQITLTTEFDNENYFNDWLGIKYFKDEVKFRLWAPVSKEVILVINDDLKYYLKKGEKGVFEISISNDYEWLDKKSYYYLVRNDLEFEKCLDPYGYSISSDLKSCYIFDFEKTIDIDNSFYKEGKKISEPIIYEVNVRDFTISLPIKHKGEFLGIIEASNIKNHGIDYIKSLGITHIQLMPVFAFGGVDYLSKSSKNEKFAYNWGYNPILYNALCGWYVSNPDDPYCQINEFKMLVNEIHKSGLGINLDVVFNHVYETANYSLNKIVPGYPYRYFNLKNNFLEISNGSWCGNDIATERLMNRKFIIDSLKYYQDTFKIDGFRFDLMGLIDVETINLIKEELAKVNLNVLLYGEGWDMNTAYPKELLATMYNQKKLNGIGFFNDEFRNAIKGNNNKEGLFFGKFNKALIEKLLNGTEYGINSINYVECHDNLTFYDQQKLFGFHNEKIKENAKIALALVLFSKGIPFIHSGQEVLRTKMGIDNSYNSSDFINKFPWHLTFVHSDLVEYTKLLIDVYKKLHFSKYELLNVEIIDGLIICDFKYKKNQVNLYINLSDKIKNIVINLEEIIFCTDIVRDNNIKLNRGILITKSNQN